MIHAPALNCTLKPSPAPSSTEKLAGEVLAQLASLGTETEMVRVVDHTVSSGVQTDMGGADQGPGIRQRILAADIVVFATPTWVGKMSSVATRVIERLDTELSETDPEGRPILFGTVAVTAVVGNASPAPPRPRPGTRCTWSHCCGARPTRCPDRPGGHAGCGRCAPHSRRRRC